MKFFCQQLAILWLIFLSDNDSCTLIFLMSPVFSLRFPPKLCTMCNCLHCAISLRFPLDSILATGTVIFLRFFNPALGNILSWSPLWLWALSITTTTTILPLSWFPGPSGVVIVAVVIVAVVSHCDIKYLLVLSLLLANAAAVFQTVFVAAAAAAPLPGYQLSVQFDILLY